MGIRDDTIVESRHLNQIAAWYFKSFSVASKSNRQIPISLVTRSARLYYRVP
jgi:hypothetical protein